MSGLLFQNKTNKNNEIKCDFYTSDVMVRFAEAKI